MFNPLRYFRERRIAARRRDAIAAVMQIRGVSEAVATKAVDQAKTQRPLLDWLASLDWAALLKLALTLLPLILAAESEEKAES